MKRKRKEKSRALVLQEAGSLEYWKARALEAEAKVAKQGELFRALMEPFIDAISVRIEEVANDAVDVAVGELSIVR